MVSQVIADIDERRRDWGEQLDPARRAAMGQYFTPADVADFMAQQLQVSTDRPVRLLDPGAGVGSLTAAVVARWSAEGGGPVTATAVEADPVLQAPPARTLDELSRMHAFNSTVVAADFVEWGADRVSGFGVLDASKFDVVVMNPPYRKIHTASAERRRMSAAGIEVPNLYAGFAALAAGLLDEGGQLVAITPRSFTNGPYFRRFRKLLLETVGLRRVHVFDARDLAFADNEVLQENVIFSGTRGHRPTTLVVSSSRSVSHVVRARTVPYEEVVRPDDPEAFLHITTDEQAAEHARRVGALPCRLRDLEVEVSTGPVVDFRAKEHLRSDPEPGAVPLVYPNHLRDGRVSWPQVGGRKPNGLVHTQETARLLMPAGTYVLVKRFSAKEERRRIVAVVVTPADLPGDAWAFENHLNVFHRRGEGLPDGLARGLAAFLNTTTIDQFFRQFNGHTQVNATDLRSLRYASEAELVELGSAVTAVMAQADLDAIASELVSAFAPPIEARTA
ncbi:MAG: Eco57I restriction-modification methylase domain-containing protein [Acidimicrobiales bacterium]